MVQVLGDRGGSNRAIAGGKGVMDRAVGQREVTVLGRGRVPVAPIE